jgi:hypothetical protein
MKDRQALKDVGNMPQYIESRKKWKVNVPTTAGR